MKPARHQWYICGFIFFATVLNYMNRQTLSIAGPLIEKEFHLNNSQLGLLFSAFYVTYGFSVAVIGEIFDRVSIRIAFAAAVVWWSVATMLTSVAHTFLDLIGFRMLLGIGESGNWPATARLVSMYLAPGERTLANSLYMGGGSLGLVIVQPLLIWLSLQYGWRVGFLVIGSLSVVWVVAWLAYFKPSNLAGLRRYDDLQRGAEVASWRAVLGLPRFWGLMVASLFGNTCLYFLMNWLPTFLVQDRKFSFNLTLGGVVLIPFLGLDLGYLLSGFVVLRLSRRKIPVLRARRLVFFSAASIMSVSVTLTPFAHSDALVVILLFLTTLGMAGWNSNYLCFVEELSERKVSAVAGVVGSIGAFGGAVSLWLAGWISQSFGSFTPVFALVGLMIWLGSFGIVFTPEPRPTESFVNA